MPGGHPPSPSPCTAAKVVRTDVVVLGGGQAGLSLARHLLLDTDRQVLLLERRAALPPAEQKVGESTVQVAGFYFSRVLELEEHLWDRHFMKYNLRFCWPSAGRANDRFEDYSQAFIRGFSNIPSYQLDRNVLEAELLRLNLEDPRFTLRLGVSGLEVELGDPHLVRCRCGDETLEIEAKWVIDTTGRQRFLARRQRLDRPSGIDHAAVFWWVEGRVDVDRLSDLSPRELRKKPERRFQGHLPAWLATNHFAAEGLWLWVIPLRGKTSLGLVFDKQLAGFDFHDVSTLDKAVRKLCELFPCLARDLPRRRVLAFRGYPDFSYDCAQTIDEGRWAITGEAGRFSDPLYSPGGDLIALHNTLIVDAVQTCDRDELTAKCRLDEQLLRALYQAYVPSYARSYDTLGDAEVFSLKYTWELTIYFAFYVFPFINDLFTDRRFVTGFLRRFARLGPLNRQLQAFLSDYYHWKKTHLPPTAGPLFYDFMDLGPLREAERTFYEVGITVDEARRVLERQTANLEELARYVVAHVASRVTGEPRVVTSGPFVAGIDLESLRFDPDELRRRATACLWDDDVHVWSFDPHALERFWEPASDLARTVP